MRLEQFKLDRQLRHYVEYVDSPLRTIVGENIPTSNERPVMDAEPERHVVQRL